MPKPPAKDQVMLGIGLKAASVVAFSGMMVFLKASEGLPPGQVIFFRALMSLAVLGGFFALRGQLAPLLRTRRPLGHVWRGLVGTAGMMFSVLALTRLPLPEAVAISFATPLVIVLFGALFLRETVHAHRWAAVGVGLAGVVLVSWPRLTIFSGGGSPEASFGVIFAIIGCAFSAAVALQIKQLVRTERSPTIVLYFFITSTVFSAASLPFGWVTPTPEQWLIMIGVGVTSVAGQMFMTESYRHADVSVLAPMDYLSLLFSIALGYFIFADVPTWQMLLGGAVILVAGSYLVLRERRLSRG